ncbi:MAG: T9SS type A sorting domain-containing protein [Planctomycetota bacterium]|jgi:cytoskeletal protein CcmA (bactofilin family)
MKGKGILALLVLVMAVNVGLLNAGEIKLVRAFETWNAGIIKSTDPAGIVYHPPSGHLYIADSEINEIATIWNCENVFEVNLTGDQVFNSFDSYALGGRPCPPLIEKFRREPTGITYNEFDSFFYITNDDRNLIMRYNGDEPFGEPFAEVTVDDADLEGITSDPSTGNLYAVVGVEGINSDGIGRVLVYNSDLQFQSEFSVDDRVGDPEGIAYNEQLNHLFLVSQSDMKVFEYTLSGEFVTDYDISHLIPSPMDPQGLTFAPSSDPNDHPGNFNLYIADGQLDNDPYPDERDGIIYEAEIFPFDFFAEKKFKADKHGNSQGNVHSNDKIEIKKGLPSTFTGNLTAVKDIKIEEKNTVNGNVIAGGKLEIKSGATVNGTAFGNAAVSTVRLPVVSFEAGGAEIKLNDDEIRSLDPGSYGNVEAGKRSTLILSSGEYFFKNLNMKDDATLSAHVTEGEVMINVVDEVKFHKRARVDIESGQSDSRYLTLKQVKDKDIKFDEDSHFGGSIIAPLAKVKLERNVVYKGSIMANEIEVKENATLNTHSASLNLAKTFTPETEYNTEHKTREKVNYSIPSGFSLSQNYPNPFNPETQISFQLPTVTHVVIKIYNVRGQEILRLMDRTYTAGTHTVRWDGRDNHGNLLPSGVYFYRLQAGEFLQVKKMNLLK